MCWRVEHLPLYRVRRRSDWEALSSLESRAVWKVADRYQLDDDQRYSLYAHHNEHVERVGHAAKPTIIETHDQRIERYQREGHHVGWFDRRWRRAMPGWMVGWPTWFGNRRAGLRDKRFWLLTRLAYRGQPG
jgi:hypothetical protein